MKKNLSVLSILLLLFLWSGRVYSQQDGSTEETSTSLGESRSNTKKFTNADKMFNDWSAAVFFGGNVLQGADLVSWGSGRFTPGYDIQVELTKQITHAVGINLQYQMGQTRQFNEGMAHYDSYYPWEAKTKYQAISLLGDINLSSLFRRVDNHSPYRWALHAYGGLGILGYEASRMAVNSPQDFKYHDWRVVTDQSLSSFSVFWQIGTGLMYKLSPRFDLELKAMYFMSGDEEFDASGPPSSVGQYTLADYEEGRDDNMVTFSLGIHYKFGKHKEHLRWHDPLKSINNFTPDNKYVPCSDDDGDGVCNDQDKCPDTPFGVKIDGAGCPLDSDNDGVYDSIDECPTIPGPPTNNGCPLPIVEISVGTIAENLTRLIEGIEFDYNQATIREISYPKLNAAFDVLDAHPDYRFIVEGHTDAAGSAQYNMELSNRRAQSVVRYLVNKGLAPDQLIPVGKGESDLKYPECDPTTNCPPWKNLENRRVVFKAYDKPVENLEYKQ